MEKMSMWYFCGGGGGGGALMKPKTISSQKKSCNPKRLSKIEYWVYIVIIVIDFCFLFGDDDQWSSNWSDQTSFFAWKKKCTC